LYVVRFQEIVPLNAGNVLGPEDSGPAAKWLGLIREALNSNEELDNTGQNSPKSSPRYCLAASKQMVGIFLSVWVRADLCNHVTNLKVSCVGRGIMGYLGNKVRYSNLLYVYLDTTTYPFLGPIMCWLRFCFTMLILLLL